MPRRTPAIFWLLMAATICVDAVSMFWAYDGKRRLAEGFYIALVCGQLSALCAWASFSSRPLARTLVAFIFAIAASLWAGIAGLISNSLAQTAVAYAGLWLSHVALVSILFWTMKRTVHGRQLGKSADALALQFSIKHLLTLMTTLAILIVILRTSEIIQEVWLWVLIVIVNNALVAISCVLVHGTAWHGLARCASTAGVAAFLGSILYLIRGWPEIIAVNLIHAFVLFAWLEIGGIMPRRGAGHADDAPA